MNMHAHLREAIANLMSAKLRSFLAVLGVLVGTASVVALISGGQLATEHALEQFKKLGTDLFAVSVQKMQADQDSSQVVLSASEQIDQMMDIKHTVPAVINLAPYVMTSDHVDYSGTLIQGFILGATTELAEILKLTMHSGRFISALDTTEYYCVVGHKVAQTMIDAGANNIIGAQILIGKQYYTVLGELNPTKENLFVFVDLNRSIVIPLQSLLEKKSKAYINNLVFKVKSEQNIGSINPQVTAGIHKVYPGARLFFRSPQEIIRSMESQSQTFNLLLGFIGSIALIVGGIGVMNIMLVWVVERKKEIGIRLAVGARARDIQYMFLTEAVVLTLFGGILGVLLGELIAFFTATVSGWTFHFYIVPPIVGFLVSALSGMFFGYYPAKKAALLDPIESLRSD